VVVEKSRNFAVRTTIVVKNKPLCGEG